MPLHTERQPRILACDVDDVLVPAEHRSSALKAKGLADLGRLGLIATRMQQNAQQKMHFGAATGRTKASLDVYQQQISILDTVVGVMDFTITGVGTEIHIRDKTYLRHNTAWPQTTAWDQKRIRKILDRDTTLTPQLEIAQNEYKVSYYASGWSDDQAHVLTSRLQTTLAASAIKAEVIFSGGTYLDIMPPGVNKGTALACAADILCPADKPYIIAAGDSLNDCAMLEAADLAILPANAHDSLMQWAQEMPHKTYVARTPFAAGIIEGLEAYDLIP